MPKLDPRYNFYLYKKHSLFPFAEQVQFILSNRTCIYLICTNKYTIPCVYIRLTILTHVYVISINWLEYEMKCHSKEHYMKTNTIYCDLHMNKGILEFDGTTVKMRTMITFQKIKINEVSF